MIVGYTSLMCPEAMNLPYLECLASWAQVCDKIAICYSVFPELDIPIPEGAVKPWEYDGALEILEKFDDEVLGGKLVLTKHVWDPDNPREDGLTKQMARDLALKQFISLDGLGWTIQFDADEILRELLKGGTRDESRSAWRWPWRVGNGRSPCPERAHSECIQFF